MNGPFSIAILKLPEGNLKKGAKMGGLLRSSWSVVDFGFLGCSWIGLELLRSHDDAVIERGSVRMNILGFSFPFPGRTFTEPFLFWTL